MRGVSVLSPKARSFEIEALVLQSERRRKRRHLELYAVDARLGGVLDERAYAREVGGEHLQVVVLRVKDGAVEAQPSRSAGGFETELVHLHELGIERRDRGLGREYPLREAAGLEALRIGHVGHEVRGPV